MRVEGNSRAASVARGVSSRQGNGGGAVFAPDAGSAGNRVAAAALSTPVSDIGALLALQAVEDPLFAKKKAVRRGLSLLDALEDIKADLLGGGVGEGRLNQLMALITQAREKSVPGLDALLDDIELRARVELAKFGRFPEA